MKEQIRVLKEGGKLFIDQANFMSLRTLADLLFLYPMRTSGKHGGLRWLLNKEEIIKDYHEGKLPGKDEDVRSLIWWYKKMKKFDDLKIEYVHSPLSKRFGIEDIGFKSIVSFFSKNIRILCTKETRKD